jgi:hypothetical protein
MPILLSQIVMRPFLFTIAALNVVLLGVCGYLLFASPRQLHPAAPLSPNSHFSTVLSTPVEHARTIPANPDLAGASFQADPPAAGTSPSGAPAILAVSLSGQPSAATLDREREQLWSSAGPGSNAPAAGSGAPVFQSGPVQAAAGQDISGPIVLKSAAAPASSTPSGNTSAGVPLAFTAFDNGASASPSQASTLRQLQTDFVNDLGGANQNPNDPAYAQNWQSALLQSDARFRQQFGWQAFVQAEVAQERTR